jgi:hypothetical protein
MVAKAYHSFMTDYLGVEINLDKSIQSESGTMEFAKRLVTPTSDLSPIGPKNIILSLKAPANIPTLFCDYMKKGGRIEFATVNDLISSLSHDIVKISKSKLEYLLWSITGPFGSVDSGSRFGPAKVETTLSYFKVFAKSLDMDVTAISALDDVLKDELEHAKWQARNKTQLSLNALTSIQSVRGFEGLSPKGTPSFTSLQISAVEIYSELFDSGPVEIPQSPDSLTTVFEILQWKLDRIKPVLPLSNCLVKQVVHRPRFRSIGINFFKKVDRRLNTSWDEMVRFRFGIEPTTRPSKFWDVKGWE